MTKLDLLKEQLKTTGCISFHINDLMDADILNGEFLYNFQSDKSCYSKDMDCWVVYNVGTWNGYTIVSYYIRPIRNG